MKKFKFLVLIIVLISCNKSKNENNVLCTPVSNIEYYLIGKWQLVTRQCAHTNTITCSNYGGDWYPVTIFPSNHLIEILSSGTINIYKNDVKIHSFIGTSWISSVPNSGRITLNCGNNSLLFSTLNLDDTLSTIQLGSKVYITNQFIDLNFENYPSVSKCIRQQFIKIE